MIILELLVFHEDESVWESFRLSTPDGKSNYRCLVVEIYFMSSRT